MSEADWETTLRAKRWADAHPRSAGAPVVRELLDFISRREQGYHEDRYDARKMRDQARVIRDQAAYIRSLEEQLAPHLVKTVPPEQEALL